MEEELVHGILDNFGLPITEPQIGRDIDPEEFVIEYSELVATEAIDAYAGQISERFVAYSDNVEVENLIGDADYVIDVETSPEYNIPTREAYETAVSELIDHLNTTTIESVEEERIEETDEAFNPFDVEDSVAEEIIQPTIPVNSNTILINETTSRFTGADWYNQITKEKVILAGVGGIGSYVGFLLGRLNIDKLTMFDDDIVDTVNLSGQLYSMENIGEKKVNALASTIINYANFYKVSTYPTKYTELSISGPIMICGFDNMTARNIFFNSWLGYVNMLAPENKKDCLFIDGRLAAEEYQILCLRGDDEYSINKYKEEFLFSDSQADATLCSYKQTTFMANQIASNMVNLFVNFVANKCNPNIERYLPFYTEYNAETMFFKTIS